MNKNVIKIFSRDARNRLMHQVRKRAAVFGITADNIQKPQTETDDSIVINGRVYNKDVKEQRKKLVEHIMSVGFENAVEEVAYTWFNRLIAIRFMEVNGFLPTGVRVLSSVEVDKTEPDIINQALQISLPISKEKIYEYQDKNDIEGLYKYLLVTQCNELSEIMPFLFEKINDYTELLLPGNLLHSESVINRMVNEIEESDWQEVEIIGWLYQHYISEKKDVLIKAKKKYSTDDIPAVTQLFTPKWIVKYMVQNSLGRYWKEAHPETELQRNWEFYLESRDQETREKLQELKNPGLSPEEITVFDPAMGSGHILVYAFEVLYDIYKSKGYIEKDIPKLILTKNLFGLDIDERATQLASFALLMKARQYSRRIFSQDIRLNVHTIMDSAGINKNEIELFSGYAKGSVNYEKVEDFLRIFKDAKTLGSIIQIPDYDKEFLLERLNKMQGSDDLFAVNIVNRVRHLIIQAGLLDRKYDIVVANPPYMSGKYFNLILKEYISRVYPDTKSDLFAVFIQRGFESLSKHGYHAMVTMNSWMFLSSYAKLRNIILNEKTILTMAHLGPRAFDSISGEVVQTTVCVMCNNSKDGYRSSYIRLIKGKNENEKKEMLIRALANPEKDYRYTVNSKEFSKIPGSPIAYWVGTATYNIFKTSKTIDKLFEIKQGLITGENDRFLRKWYEVDNNKISNDYHNLSNKNNLKWVPFNKGGEFRKWYGNNEFVVNWLNDGYEIKNFFDDKGKLRSRPQNLSYYFRKGITWTKISSSSLGVRICDEGFIFSDAGSCIFCTENEVHYVLCYLCSNIAQYFLNILSATMNINVGDIGNLPIIIENSKLNNISGIGDECINICRLEWDKNETSWNFDQNPLKKHKFDNLIQTAYDKYCNYWKNNFYSLHKNEEEINKIFIDIYGLQDEMTPDVPLKEVTILQDETYIDEDTNELVFKKDVIVKQFISYAVGCMLGRYSLDVEGLAYAGGEFDETKYTSFEVDDDAIIPVLDDDYFEDDIVARFVEFVRITFGKDTVSENLEFIADALGKKGNETAVDTIRKYFMKQFYKDHVQMYKKRPIYWMFTSGKKQGFNALIYMHRYNKSMVAKIRTDYLHELQGKFEITEQHLRDTIEKTSNNRERVQSQKKLNNLLKQKEELRKYDELLRDKADQQIEIDLDDGVNVNYEKFKGLVVKI